MKTHYLKIIAIAGFVSLACTTKVSEWVLLNTVPNQYTLVYFHKAQVSAGTQKLNELFTKSISEANISFRDVTRKDIAGPYYALYYGDRQFSTYSNLAEMSNLISSPVRDSVAKELKSGKLCVMVFLKSGIPEKDVKRRDEIRKALSGSPFGKIIPVLEISRSDVNENHFISMLLNVESDLKEIREPMLFGVFGRFKALEPLVAGGITQENIDLMIDFLTADCSCLIKDNLPGTDILYVNKWESPATALVNAILDANPELMH